jgi:cytochrome c-type biogenesis protein CcmH
MGWLPLGVLALMLFAAVIVAATASSDESSVDRAHRLGEQIKCPVCVGQSVTQSRAGAARSIFEDIQRRVKAGESDEVILAAMAQSYGAEQLLRPAGTGISAFVWALPVAVGVLGIAGYVALVRKWKIAPAGVLSDADRERVQRAARERLGHDVGQEP